MLADRTSQAPVQYSSYINEWESIMALSKLTNAENLGGELLLPEIYSKLIA